MDDTGNSLPQYEIEINGEIHNLPEYNQIVPQGDFFVVRLDLSPLLGRPAYFTVPFFPAEFLLDARRLVLSMFSHVRLPLLLQSAADGFAQRVADYTYDAFLNHDFAASRLLPINVRVLSAGNYSLNVVDQLDDVELAVTESLSTFRTVPTTKSSVEALEEVQALESCDQHCCVICLEEYNLSPNHDDDNKSDDHQKALKLPCSHIFHKDCLVLWFQINHLCPLCRYAMPT
ncbi:hypothetical protein TIFTF001_014375 [Ficus carica]|uniref:RING-type E3 ubiquitin transferase n=1 Tax=Ficus carica TaxID=3494 RepID=A0AA88D5J3_FICCA|nr:hypothetical protein TIFTF001_014375 [Ficus carica]